MTLKKKDSLNQKRLYGLNKYFLDLTKLVTAGKLPKVLMFTGKKGQGKFTLTHHLMSYFFDKFNYDLSLNVIKNNNKIFDGIKDNINTNIMYFDCANKGIKIDQIRKLRTHLQKTSIDNKYRFIIFDDVEFLNESCVNALLKTIEEPKDADHFILINNQSNSIIDTLKSRSLEIIFFLNKTEKIEIIEKLLSDFNIKKMIDPISTTLAPGEYVKFNSIILEDKIDLKDELIKNIKKLLKINKIKKNIDYLNFAIYLINQYYFYKSKHKSYTVDYNDKRTNIIRKIYDTNKLNLNHTNLITELENYI